MSNKSPTDKPLNATLDEAFQYELKKRDSLNGLFSAAQNGDRKALRDLAGWASVILESAAERDADKEFSDLAERLMFALSSIESGEEPNVAFGWKKKSKGRPSARKDFDELMKRWIIGQHIAGLLANNPGMSEQEAFRIVAEKRHTTQEKARNSWEQWEGKKRVM